jgi:spermidine/putrescine-binding protein
MMAGRPLSRRSLVAATALGVIPAGARALDEPRAIRLLCRAEYDRPDIMARFEKQTAIDVQTRHVRGADEIALFLRASPGEYDVAVLPDGLVAAQARAGLLQPLDLDRLANAETLWPPFQSPPWTLVDGVVYGLPVSWQTSPLVYDAAELAEPPARWLDLDDESFRGKIVFLDDAVAHFLVWNRALGAAEPALVTMEQLEATTLYLLSLKRRLALAFVDTPAGVAAELAAGGWVASVGAESIPGLAKKGVDLRLARPEPGDFATCDCFCIVAGARDLDAVYAFLDHMLAAETQAAIGNELHRGAVAAPVSDLLSEAARGLFDYAGLDILFARSPFFGYPPLVVDGGVTVGYLDWVKAWDRVRFGPMEAFAPPTPVPTPGPAETPSASAS